MRVLQIGADRSKRGILYPHTPAYVRQEAYAKEFGELDIIAFSRKSDDAQGSQSAHLRIIPTNSSSAFWYGLDALRVAKDLPRPDIVSAQDPFETGLVAWLLARRFGVPFHVQVHTDFLSLEYSRGSFINHIRVWIAGFLLRRATRVRVVSERVKQELVARYHLRAPVTVLPIFVDVEALKHAKADPELFGKFAVFRTKLLIVSRLEPEKNVELALRAFTEVPKDACLIIVGAGSESERLRSLAGSLGVMNRVFFEGEKPGIQYYALADLVLVTSRYEGYGLVIIEALASGKPVLSTDVGIAREESALISSEADFAVNLRTWFENGPRVGSLKSYSYKNFGYYVRAYADDIRACTKTK